MEILDASPYQLFIGNHMTPTFYTFFSLLQRTLTAFNKKCDCKGVSVIIQFEQSLGTQKANNDTHLWVGRFLSETLGTQRFGGTQERVSELLTTYISQLIGQTLEACIANATGENGWFNDKPEVIEEVYNLYEEYLLYKTVDESPTQ